MSQVQRLWWVWIGGALARLSVLWLALAALAWVVSRDASGSPGRWLSLAAPLALVWSDAHWRSAAGPVALGALGRRPIAAPAAVWLSLAPFAALAPAARGPEAPTLTFSTSDLTTAGGLTVTWDAHGAHRREDSRPFANLPAPVPLDLPTPLDPGPWRVAALLGLGLALHRRGAPAEALGLAGGLTAAALAFAWGEAMPWGLSP